MTNLLGDVIIGDVMWTIDIFDCCCGLFCVVAALGFFLWMARNGTGTKKKDDTDEGTANEVQPREHGEDDGST